MQVCAYLVPAISRIRPGTAVERRDAGVCVPGPGDLKASSWHRRARVDTDLHFYAPQQFLDESLKSPGPSRHIPAFLHSTTVPERILEIAGTG